MAKQEVLVTRLGEMLDMIACLAIYNGRAKPKKRKLTFDEIMSLE